MARRRMYGCRWPLLGLVAVLFPAMVPAAAQLPTDADYEILTFHGDPARTGWNPAESVLTPAAVGSSAFGRVWTRTVNGEIYAEPLVVLGLQVNGIHRAVVYAATEQDAVYALDAGSGERLWGPVSLGTPVPHAALSCGNIDPVGITSTPVIDRGASTLYAVGLVTSDGGSTMAYKIGALDLATGAMRPGWPIVVAPPSIGGLRFDPSIQQQRGALTLLHGTIYVPFGGYQGDCGDYHGWVVGIPEAHPDQQEAFVTPTHRMGGVWSAMAADASGNLYAATGNSDSTGPVDLSDSIVRLATVPVLHFSGQAQDLFTPSNFVALNAGDTDLGSTAPLVLPSQPGSTTPDLVFIAGKQGVGYLLNRANLGGLSRGDGVTGEGVYSRCVFGVCLGGDVDKVYSATAYWDGAESGRFILVPGHGNQPAPCQGTGGIAALRLGTAPETRSSTYTVAWCSPSMADAGAPVVSSADSQGGLVWVVDAGGGVLYALNARTGEAIYASSGKDALGSAHRFVVPSVASGHVFVGASHSVVAYGLR